MNDHTEQFTDEKIEPQTETNGPEVNGSGQQNNGVSQSPGQDGLQEGNVTQISYIEADGESSMAAGMVAIKAGELIFEKTEGVWYRFHGHWQRDETDKTEDEVVKEVRKTRANLGFIIKDRTTRKGIRTAMARSTFVKGTLNIMRVDQRINIHHSKLNANPTALGTPSGWVDLKTGEMHPPDPQQLITMVTTVDPAPKADCPKWIAFLAEAHDDDQEVIRYLQKLAGYAATAMMTAQLLHYHFGPGGNGKSVFMNVRQRIMGPYMQPATETAFTLNSAGQRNHLSELAVLRGVRSVPIAEPEKGLRWDMGRAKTISGGDPIKVNFMRKESFFLQPVCKLEMIANHKLKIGDVDGGVRRRMRMVPWLQKPKVEIGDYDQILVAEEGPEILRWIIDGALLFFKEGLSDVPKAIGEMTEDYLNDEDDIGRFLKDCFHPCDEINDIRMTTIKNIYKQWGKETDTKIEPGKLTANLKDKGLRVLRPKGVNHLRGYRLSEVGEIFLKEFRDENQQP